jgi:transposase
LQTSDALGAAAAQLVPVAQAAVVELNKQAGLPHAKISRCLESLFGIPLTHGGSAQVVLRAEPALDFLSQFLRGTPIPLVLPP